MINIEDFMKRYLSLLENEFGTRLWFVGLQGSYARGEATESSDIDIVVILDKLSMNDIHNYNKMFDAVPEKDLLCGFISGKSELLNWDAAELFQFYYDTKPILGSLDELLLLIDDNAIDMAIKSGACTIYHACVHNMLYDNDVNILKGLYKSASFVLQAIGFKNTGKYISNKTELQTAVDKDGQNILNAFLNIKNGDKVDFCRLTELLFNWSKKLINENEQEDVINYTITPYEEKYRDDLIFMILEAKNALGKIPSINADLLDIESNYFNKGDKFWIAVDDNDRVIASIGYNSISDSNEVWLHRLYIKPCFKRRGIGTALLKFVENYLADIGKNPVRVHLGAEEYNESRFFYLRHGYSYYAARYMSKILKTDYDRIIGKKVKGIVDRPIGSYHPEYKNMIYPVNYGYIPGVNGGDGELQDAYFLGPDQPLSEFAGTVIAVYHRFDDIEDKWIVADNNNYTDEEILEKINFQEKYFNGRLYR